MSSGLATANASTSTSSSSSPVNCSSSSSSNSSNSAAVSGNIVTSSSNPVAVSNSTATTTTTSGIATVPPAPSSSPPSVTIDSSPLHTTMDKNKESLKVKLMLRRPINQLIAQGIMPSLKTPPAFHEQRQKLERAKTGDLLKAKIQRRPEREELVRQHILEADMDHVDPSLAERQRMLKKAKLADSLNDQLSHRPGPLELIQKNILHTEEPIERAVKSGVIPFRATSEGLLRKPQHPSHYTTTTDDDSQSSENSSSAEAPPIATTRTSDVLETAAASAGIVTVALLSPFSPISVGGSSSTSSLSPVSSVASPATPRPGGKGERARKKSIGGKVKAQVKAKTIKFHEYKGPPSAQKISTSSLSSANASSSTESSYDLLLQQQQLFLQWQLEWQHKYPQILLPATPKPSASSSQQPVVTVEPTTNNETKGKLEDMKVSDLKEELKRRNLPVSGAKPQLIERLRGAAPSTPTPMEVTPSMTPTPPPPVPSSPPQQPVSPPATPPPPTPLKQSSPPSPPPPPPAPSIPNDENIIQQQQRQIEELQRELQRSKLQLMEIQRKGESGEGKKVNVKASLAARITQHQAQVQLNELFKNRFIVPVEIRNGNLMKPPSYEVATKQQQQQQQQQVKSEQQPQENVKSEIVDDLIEILIKNGELPPSAAHAPAATTNSSTTESSLPFSESMETSVDHLQCNGLNQDAALLSNNNNNNNSNCTNNNNPSSNEECFHSNIDYMMNHDMPVEYTNGSVNLKDLGLDLETMDFGQLEEVEKEPQPQQITNNHLPVPMDMDDTWLDVFNHQNLQMGDSAGSNSTQVPEFRLYDPLLAAGQDPLDLFNLEDSDFKMGTMNWDKVDFAT